MALSAAHCNGMLFSRNSVANYAERITRMPAIFFAEVHAWAIKQVDSDSQWVTESGVWVSTWFCIGYVSSTRHMWGGSKRWTFSETADNRDFTVCIIRCVSYCNIIVCIGIAQNWYLTLSWQIVYLSNKDPCPTISIHIHASALLSRLTEAEYNIHTYSSTCLGRPPSWAATCHVRTHYQCPDTCQR